MRARAIRSVLLLTLAAVSLISPTQSASAVVASATAPTTATVDHMVYVGRAMGTGPSPGYIYSSAMDRPNDRTLLGAAPNSPSVLISPDGKRVAWVGTAGDARIHVSAVTGRSQISSAPLAPATGRVVKLLDWSADGTKLLVQLEVPGSSSQAETVAGIWRIGPSASIALTNQHGVIAGVFDQRPGALYLIDRRGLHWVQGQHSKRWPQIGANIYFSDPVMVSSPDGLTIAILSLGEVRTLSVGGHNVGQVRRLSISALPDSATPAFSLSFSTNSHNLYVTTLPRLGKAEGRPAWPLASSGAADADAGRSVVRYPARHSWLTVNPQRRSVRAGTGDGCARPP